MNAAMQTSHNPVPRIAISILLALVIVAYVGNYVILVNPDKDAVAASKGTVLILESPDYLLGGDIAACVFWPLEQLDRRLRPDTWWMC
jgi:hypothetical protein